MNLKLKQTPTEYDNILRLDNTFSLEGYTNDFSMARIGAWILGLGLVIFLLWAAFAPLDEGVPTEGVVSIETNHKTVQHLTGGIVGELLVKEGQEVHQGDVLLKLDENYVRARYQEIRQRYFGLRAQESRLVAEKIGKPNIIFHEDLLKNRADPFIQQHMINQSQLLQARQNALAGDIASKYESISGQKAMVEGYQGVLESNQSQLSLLQEQLNGIRELVKEGYAPRNQQNDLEQKVAQTYGEIASTKANILRSNKTILELTQQINTRQQIEKKEVDTEMAQVKLQVESDADKFKSLQEELARTTLFAPASGQVAGLQVHTVGGVIQPGQKIMDIVPANEPLIIDAQIQPHLIDKIHVGQDADVRFSTFSNTPQLLVEGKLVTISKDLFTKPATAIDAGGSYYLARISVTPKGVKDLAGRQLQPGMPVQVVIKTGERTLLTYLLHPLTKRIAASMKEE
ncbi:MAG: HlyD family type I secretion periplasmic adaptor subunit [Methylotenera sp.]